MTKLNGRKLEASLLGKESFLIESATGPCDHIKRLSLYNEIMLELPL